ncbi:MAG: AAA family ATPase [Candidatus Heimdallarchaeota archaeon]
MKKFQITKINLENIKTYISEEISFSLGNNVLLGENGAGKSTILESIFLSIFGETVPGRRLVDMIRYGERQGRIITRFSVNGEDYRLEHAITRSDADRANQSQILWNETTNERIAEHIKAVRAKIEEILGIDATTFISAVYASQGEIGKIVTSKEKERKKLFDRLFQIDRYEKTWQNLSKVDKIINTQITILQGRSEDLREDVKSLPSIENQINEKKKQLKSEKSQLVDLNKAYKDLDQRYKEIGSALEEYRKLEGIKGSIEEEIHSLDIEIKSSINQLSTKTDTELLEITLSTFNKFLKSNESSLDNTKLSLEKTRKEETELSINLETIKNLERNLAKLLRLTNEKQQQLNKDIKEISDEMSELGLDITKWQEKIPDIIEKNKNELQIHKKEMRKSEGLLRKISVKEAELKALEESSSRYQSKIVKNRLFLSKEAGDDWKNIIQEYSEIDFNKQSKNLEKEIIELDESTSQQKNKKSLLEMNINRIKEDLDHLNKLQGEETCPTCKQNLSAETLAKLCSELTEEKAELCGEKKKVKENLGAITNSFNDSKKKETDLREKFRIYEKTSQTFDDLLDLEKEKDEIELKYEKMEGNIKELKEKFSQEKADELEEKISDLEEKISNINNIKKSIPRFIKTSDQIKDELKEAKEMKVKISQLKKKYTTNILNEKTSEISQLCSLEDQLTEIVTITKGLIEKFISQQEDKAKLTETISKLNTIESLEGFKDREEIQNNWKKMSEKIASYNTSILALKDVIIPPLEKQKIALQEKMNQLTELDKKSNQENKKKKIVSILRSLMRELPNRLLPNYIERISNTATEILQSIAPESDIQSIIVNDDYSLNIIRLGNIEDISVLSGGETIIIALALRLAFAKEFSSLDTLILDEPTIFLDERRRGELVSVLEKNRLVSQMFVVTHDPDFERIADKTHLVNKIRGETSINTIEVQEPEEKESELVEFELA